MYLTKIIEERDYKVEAWGEEKRMILLEAPTGCGKTFFAQRLLPKICLENDTHMAIIVNRRVLKEQVEKKNMEYMFENHLEASPIRVFSYQELEQSGRKVEKKLEYLETCEFIVCDEAAYWVFDSVFNPAAEKSFLRIMRLMGKASLLWMTATPGSLKILLDGYINLVNKQRQEEWEKRCNEMESRKNDYLYYDKADESFAEYAELLADYPESEECESGIFDPGSKPKPYSYESITQSVQDYSYVKLNRYDSQKKLLEIITNSPKREKWLIYVHTRKEGHKLKKEIEAAFQRKGDVNRSVAFLSSDYRANEKMQKTVEKIVNEEKYSESVLITTAVLDTGVTISDKKVRNIVINTFSEGEFKQMLGRRRVKEGETINLFICGDLSYFKKCRKLPVYFK